MTSPSSHVGKIPALASVVLMLLAGCKPPATDDTSRGAMGRERDAPLAPAESPDTVDAIWAPSQEGETILYGVPGQMPFLAIGCIEGDGDAELRITRFAEAEPRAQALMAIVGNGHTSRLPIDAKWTGRVWLWEGSYPAADDRLDALAGPRSAELTLPGAGTVVLNSATLPGRLIDACRTVTG